MNVHAFRRVTADTIRPGQIVREAPRLQGALLVDEVTMTTSGVKLLGYAPNSDRISGRRRTVELVGNELVVRDLTDGEARMLRDAVGAAFSTLAESGTEAAERYAISQHDDDTGAGFTVQQGPLSAWLVFEQPVGPQPADDAGDQAVPADTLPSDTRGLQA